MTQKKTKLGELHAECHGIIKRIKPRLANEAGNLCEKFEKVIENTYSRGSISGLRTIAADLREWMGEFNKEDEKILSEVNKRGHIKTEDEFRVVLRRVELLVSNAETTIEMDDLNSLLAAFEK